MPHIRLTASAGAAAVVLALALSPATARPCDHGDAGCVVSAQNEPMKLDNFIKTWKPVAKPAPVATSRTSKKSKSARKPAAKEVAPEARRLRKQPPPPRQAPAPAPIETIASESRSVRGNTDAASGSHPSTKRMRLMRQPARQIATSRWWPSTRSMRSTGRRLLRARSPRESVGQSVSDEQPDEDKSWMGQIAAGDRRNDRSCRRDALSGRVNAPRPDFIQANVKRRGQSAAGSLSFA